MTLPLLPFLPFRDKTTCFFSVAPVSPTAYLLFRYTLSYLCTLVFPPLKFFLSPSGFPPSKAFPSEPSCTAHRPFFNSKRLVHLALNPFLLHPPPPPPSPPPQHPSFPFRAALGSPLDKDPDFLTFYCRPPTLSLYRPLHPPRPSEVPSNKKVLSPNESLTQPVVTPGSIPSPTLLPLLGRIKASSHKTVSPAIFFFRKLCFQL